ncbi:MAG: malectin domain-containing carbohydrate-binding protein [Bacteroidota bacterium]
MYRITDTIPFRPNFLLSALLLIFLFSFQSAVAQTGPIMRINAGTANEATGDGETYIGDSFFSEDSSVGPESMNTISNTNNDGLYQTERISNASLSPFGYTIPLENGTYSVTLHFAETAFANAGQRVFDVQIEGVTVLDNYDILAEAGNSNTAVSENIFNIQVSDDSLDIDFISIVERAKISGIEISGAVADVSIPFALNAGGIEYISTDLTWMEDTGVYFLNEGTAFSKIANIAGTEDDDLYEAERFNNDIRFLLPGLERGNYTVELHFAETFHQTSGQRLFDIAIEGVTEFTDYDIFVEAGGFSVAIVEEFQNVPVLDGILNVTLSRSVGSATINAIAITSASSVSNEDVVDLAVPGSHKLTAAYPNPFNPQTQFSLSVAATQQVRINVYNLLGQHVQTMYNGTMAAQQEQTFSFEAGTLPSGIYLIQVQGESFLETQQVTLLK